MLKALKNNIYGNNFFIFFTLEYFTFQKTKVCYFTGRTKSSNDTTLPKSYVQKNKE